MSVRSTPSVLTLASVFALAFAAACKKEPAAAAETQQQIVERVARENPDVVRLTVHAASGGKDMTVVASTAPDKLGKPSDKEDHEAVQKGDVVVLEESGALDVTVPILQRDGRWTAAAGVTLKPAAGAARDATVNRAKEIAKAVETAMGKRG